MRVDRWGIPIGKHLMGTLMGNLLVGNVYTRKLGLVPGQECKIEIHQETGTIWLRLPDDVEGESSSDDDQSSDSDQAADA